MSRYSKICKPRNSWRQKATSRAEEIRYLRREVKRIKKQGSSQERGEIQKKREAKSEELP